ncbi:MAG: response regulator [Planctomycetaceae bacterium]|nr:response regulator [Planctomycetaceae bacterium]
MKVRPRRLSPPRVLIADDDPALRRSLATLFRLAGFAPAGASNVDQAVRRLLQRRYDVVVLDMRMPLDAGRSGRDQPDAALQVLRTLAEIRSIRRHGLVDPDTPIFVFTAYPSVHDAIEVSRAGAYYLPKTLPGGNTADQLVAQCARLVEEKRRRELDPNQTWLARHYAQLARRFAGKSVAVVEAAQARRQKLTGGVRLGERVVFAAADNAQLTRRILRSAAFRRAMPVILDVLEAAAK